MANKFSSILRMVTGQVEAAALAPELAAGLERMGFQHLGSGAHRTAWAHGDRVLKAAMGNPLQNIFEAGSSVRHPELHPHMAKVLGLSDAGHLSVAERSYGRAGKKPGIVGRVNLMRRFKDLHSGNFVGGKAVDFGIPKVRYPLEQEQQLAQTLGGTRGVRDIFSDVPGFGSWMDEFETATAQLPVPSVATVGMAGQRAARPREVRAAARRHGLPRSPRSTKGPEELLAAPESTARRAHRARQAQRRAQGKYIDEP